MILRLGRGLNELVHHVLRRGMVGVAHPKINDVFTRPACLHFQLVQSGKEIGREPFNTWKFHIVSCLTSWETGRSAHLREDLHSC